MSITIRVECFSCGRELEVVVHQRMGARSYEPPTPGEVEGNVCDCGDAFPEPDARELAAEYVAEAKGERHEI